MSIQPFQGAPTERAIVAFGQALSQEEIEKRQKDAEALEEKLNYITENVPTRIVQVMGSNAGAGSGEFHMYRMARRREMMRQERMEADALQKELDAASKAKQAALQSLEEAKTAKRRARRQKNKEKKRRKQEDGSGVVGVKAANDAASESSGGNLPEQPDLD